MWDWLRERLVMRERGLTRCIIVERTKRAEAIDVRKFFRFMPELTTIVKECTIIDACKSNPYLLLEWVKTNISYVPETADFWSYPLETLARMNGDCEDGAILLANLLLQAGYPYYKILIAVYGGHVVVEFDGKIFDWTGAGVPSNVPLWYCWNARNAYTTKENVN